MNENYDHINEYLDERVNKDDKARKLVSDFALLWNQYERTIFHGEHHIWAIKMHLTDAVKSEEIENLYNDFIEYLHIRKIPFTFDGMVGAYNIRIKEIEEENNPNSDNVKYDFDRKTFEKILNRKDKRGKAHLLLIIAAKVRNNMFHGTKGAWELPEQKGLFVICNKLLMEMLEVTNNKYI